MKLVGALVLLLVAVVASDTDYHDTTYQNGYDYTQGSSNYYQKAPGSRRTGLSGLVSNLFNPVRRQGFGDFDISGIFLIILLFGVGGVVLSLAAFFASLQSSGRGLDSDEWEIDDSIWMDQLQKDFEDSWSTE